MLNEIYEDIGAVTVLYSSDGELLIGYCLDRELIDY